jgi:hypothetical protein
MKILRIATSADWWPGVPEEERAPTLLARRLEEEAGEPVEQVLHSIWPKASSLEKLEGWLTDFDPDIVLLRANPFWYCFESPALLLERKGGPAGRWASGLILRAGRKPAIASSAPFKALRKMGVKAAAPAYYHEPEYVIDWMEQWLRTILRHELVVPVAAGSSISKYWEPDAASDARVEARRIEFNLMLQDLCERLHVICDAPVEGSVPKGKQYLASDGLHPNAEAQRLIAEAEYPFYRRAWQQLRNIEPVAAATR